ncbi:hypothetical protein PR048_000537 [Dryococelus australis]|uniref:Uncharacterized protein n=1 Tax=Dryococelus australis TaxID=614101 RepID=A0ABQ9IEY2_9NEOP|nr:hypothetical protein PR048_000537 [Dryococelus australis]
MRLAAVTAYGIGVVGELLATAVATFWYEREKERESACLLVLALLRAWKKKKRRGEEREKNKEGERGGDKCPTPFARTPPQEGPTQDNTHTLTLQYIVKCTVPISHRVPAPLYGLTGIRTRKLLNSSLPIPGRVTPDFRTWESCQTMPLVGGFSRISPVPPPFHSSALLHTRLNHPSRLSKPRC